jgi:glutamate synthase (NADPH/NADH) small chain
MGKVTGFLEFERHDRVYEPVAERVKSYKEFVVPLSEQDLRDQAARCMNCGIPYCHGTGSVQPGTPGCPVNNQIPDWNDLVYTGNWEEAARNLHSTNNFPEVTGRVCPAPCEASCTLNLDDNPVTIKSIECEIADRSLKNGWIKPEPASQKTGKKVAVIGYGIPDFKMEKDVIDVRVKQMEAEGVTFHYDANVGAGVDPQQLLKTYDAIALTGGAEAPRDLPVQGRDLDGIHYAMDFLPQQNRRVSGEPLGGATDILAAGKHVVVIGGGDTGSDCIGTSARQGAREIVQLEIMPEPPERENKLLTWPNWPLKMRTSSSHQEGAKREFAVLTQRFSGEQGKVKTLHCVHVDGKMQPIIGSEFAIKADLVLLAMGFVHPLHEGLLRTLGVELDQRGNVRAATSDYQTSLAKVFTAGDMRRGQSLVVWAIREGRQCAHMIDRSLMGSSTLPL